ncbi:MAG: NAD-dependent epimerase/dehydratase family protein [Proteobacteria bacterium]|nr:NAD-dependent epimerase/dehydratase family protein [Pseudomonadota bacterium]
MTILVTGAAGFIGYHVTHALLSRGHPVIGIDNVNDYYDPALKNARLARIASETDSGRQWRFQKVNIADRAAMDTFMKPLLPSLTHIIHLAAQAGVRYSLTHPHAYIESNIVGHLNILEYARSMPKLKHLVYASSSSVYGANTELPFSTTQKTDQPISLYAATKKSDELMSYTYSHLYNIPMTGLRFFTVYGPWGRPDMAYYSFTKDIMTGTPIKVFGDGKLKRDFTYIDDIVTGVLSVFAKPPVKKDGAPAHKIYNLGNDKSEPLMDFIRTLERAVGKPAQLVMSPMQPGDVVATHADINDARKDLGYNPRTLISDGLPKFVRWFKEYHRI